MGQLVTLRTGWTCAFALFVIGTTTPWPALIEKHLWLRASLATALFVAPGAAILHLLHCARGSWIGLAPFSLAVSVAVVGALGIAARVLGTPASSVFTSFGVAGAIAIGLAAGSTPSTLRRLTFCPAQATRTTFIAVATALACTLAYQPGLGADGFSYAAMALDFQRSPALSFDDTILANSGTLATRWWMAMWPLVAATICTLGDLHILDWYSFLATPLCATLALCAVYGLARALDLSSAESLLAVTVQLLCLLLLQGRDQAGAVFFERVDEDKVAAAFILAPVVMATIARFLRCGGWRKAASVLLTGLGLAFTHATMLAVTCLVSALFALPGIFAGETRRRVVVILIILGTLCAPGLAIRMAPHSYNDGLSYEIEAGSRLSSMRSRRLDVDGESFATARALTPPLPFLLLGVAALCGLVVGRQRPAARYVLAASVVLAVAMSPPVAWLLAKAITPFHLWRVPWFAPFGIAAALLVSTLHHLLPGTPSGSRGEALRHVWSAIALVFCVQSVTISRVAAAYNTMSDPPKRFRTPTMFCAVSRNEILEFSGIVEREINRRAVVVGDRPLNDLVRGMTVHARLVQFRNNHALMMRYGSFGPEEAIGRIRQWEQVFARRKSSEARLDLLDTLQADYLVLCHDPSWSEEVAQTHPARLARLAQVGTLYLYAVQR